MTTLILPGLGGSGTGHWQRWWLDKDPEARLVEQDDWETPDLQAWIEKLLAAIDERPGAVLVAHSLACALVAHLAARRPDAWVAGALLVAPADVDDRTRMPPAVESFAPMPLAPLPFPSIVVGSSSDPTASIARTMFFSHAWGARFVHLGASGHINIQSGFGPWPDGLILARRLRGTLRPRGALLHLVQAGAPGFV